MINSLILFIAVIIKIQMPFKSFVNWLNQTLSIGPVIAFPLPVGEDSLDWTHSSAWVIRWRCLESAPVTFSSCGPLNCMSCSTVETLASFNLPSYMGRPMETKKAETEEIWSSTAVVHASERLSAWICWKINWTVSEGNIIPW